MRCAIELSLQPFMHAGEHTMFLKIHLTPCEMCQLCHLDLMPGSVVRKWVATRLYAFRSHSGSDHNLITRIPTSYEQRIRRAYHNQ